uniref:Bifunctional inhibitor/plant lipid transfer protein/seed storage helical domain-containing protein n=1 Tax=Leersia perrieri TaxID=77586 RepID=A0A0D9VHG7_9ORYZ
MASKIVGALALVFLVLTASESQVLPHPCCRFNCCDGRPECCAASGPPGASSIDATVTLLLAAVASTAAAKARPVTAASVACKVSAGT